MSKTNTPPPVLSTPPPSPPPPSNPPHGSPALYLGLCGQSVVGHGPSLNGLLDRLLLNWLPDSESDVVIVRESRVVCLLLAQPGRQVPAIRLVQRLIGEGV
jgi:hypothetical protein